MKKITIYIIGLSFVMVFYSCKEWLTVYPQTEVTQEELLTDEAGFTDALAGTYVLMKTTSAYGLSLTMTTLEYLTSSWDVNSGSTAEYIGNFNYKNEDVADDFENIFEQLYTVIANINSMLSQIDVQKPNFETEGMFEQIKGECLGLRAYIYFDILRLYGPIPTDTNNDKILPYTTELGTTINEHITYEEYKAMLEDDMAAADSLLAIAEQSDNYTDFEKTIRMSQQSIKALKARAYLWFGETTEAYELAKWVIDSTNQSLGTSEDLADGDCSLSDEHIFALYESDLSDRYSTYYDGHKLYKGSSSTIVNTDLYGNTGTDIREANLWEVVTNTGGTSYYILTKYSSSSCYNIPLIRLSEMYLIAAETAPSTTEAQVYWDAFRTSRNLGNETITDMNALQLEIIEEYRKEFLAEGQSFYAYKRLNIGKDNFLWVPADANIDYIVPLPDSEISYQ